MLKGAIHMKKTTTSIRPEVSRDSVNTKLQTARLSAYAKRIKTMTGKESTKDELPRV